MVLTGSLLWSQAAPGDDLARAMNLAAQGRFTEAEQALRALEKQHPNEFEVRYRFGLVLLRQGKSQEAAERFEAATKQSPDSALAWLGLAQARLRLQQRKTALEAAARAAQLAKAEPPLWRALAIFYSDAGEFARAAEFEERWSRSPGSDPDSRLRLCRLRVRAADGKQAAAACLAAIEGRDSAELQQLLGDAHRLAGNPREAVGAYQRAIQLDPAEAGGYLRLGALFLDHRTPQPVIAVLESAAVRLSKNFELRRMLGLAYYQTGNFDKAIDEFLAAIDIDPDSDIGYASLETLLPTADARLPEIIARLRAFQKRRPESPVGHFLLARALAAQATAPAAEMELLLRQATKADPKFWPAYFELAQLDESRKQSDSAIQSLMQVVKLNPDYAPAHYNLAQLYAQKGDRVRAIEHRKKHHALLDRERTRTERARAESPTLVVTMEPPPAR
jgi:tetratricopeptide (TPR) repeat protein